MTAATRYTTASILKHATRNVNDAVDEQRLSILARKIEASRRSLIRSLQSAPVRKCYTVHSCALCLHDIKLGEHYADRGYGRRAHYDCVPGLGAAMEPWQIEERKMQSESRS